MSWTAFGEIAAKLITPVSNMVLARILTPEDFGVVAICNMVVSFADIITDAGFGKYLVQADFESGDDRDNCANVAFWSNMILSCIIVVMIVSNRYKIAAKLGSAAYSTVISVSSLQLIFTSVSSIQTGLFRRDFEYKKLSLTRIVISALPLVVAVPLAIRFRTYWAIVIGNVIGSFANASILTSISSWRPRLYYSIDVLSEMISYSFWSLCEGLANWIIFWFDTFIVAQVYSAYYVGL
jgi:PST family polysaccharide transporter